MRILVEMEVAGDDDDASGLRRELAAEALEAVFVVVVLEGARMRFCPSKSKELRKSLSLDKRKTC